MQFHIDLDTGDAVAGWLIPTRADIAPTLLVSARNEAPVRLRATMTRTDLSSLGLHATGEVGFLVDSRSVGSLGAEDALELWDAETGLPIYRRPRPGLDIHARLFRFIQGFGAQSRLDLALQSRFSLSYMHSELQTYATLFGLINNPNAGSIYASGHLSYGRYHQLCADKGFVTFFLLKDPVEVLAQTLIFLSLVFEGSSPIDPDSAIAPLRSWFTNTPAGWLDDDTLLEQALTDLEEPQRILLSNTAVKLLACNTDEQPRARHISKALESLATFSLVGTEGSFEIFRRSLSEMIGADPLAGYQPHQTERERRLTDRLRRSPAVGRLLDLDTTLFLQAAQAINAALNA